MSDTAQDYQKLLSDVLQKQIVILGKQISLLKARQVAGLTVNDDGQVTTISGDPKIVINQFLQEFRELSSPLVQKTMQPLLQIVIPEPIKDTSSVIQDAATTIKPLPDVIQSEPVQKEPETPTDKPEGKEEQLVPKP